MRGEKKLVQNPPVTPRTAGYLKIELNTTIKSGNAKACYKKIEEIQLNAPSKIWENKQRTEYFIEIYGADRASALQLAIEGLQNAKGKVQAAAKNEIINNLLDLLKTLPLDTQRAIVRQPVRHNGKLTTLFEICAADRTLQAIKYELDKISPPKINLQDYLLQNTKISPENAILQLKNQLALLSPSAQNKYLKSLIDHAVSTDNTGYKAEKLCELIKASGHNCKSGPWYTSSVSTHLHRSGLGALTEKLGLGSASFACLILMKLTKLSSLRNKEKLMPTVPKISSAAPAADEFRAQTNSSKAPSPTQKNNNNNKYRNQQSLHQ